MYKIYYNFTSQTLFNACFISKQNVCFNTSAFLYSSLASAYMIWAQVHQLDEAFSAIINQFARLSGENNEDLKSRVELLYHNNEGKSFPYIKGWNFLKDKHKWLNPNPPHVRRTRGWPTGEEPELFGDDALSRPPEKERKSKDQRSSNSSVTSSSQEMFQ
jgi:hypothetical protein